MRNVLYICGTNNWFSPRVISDIGVNSGFDKSFVVVGYQDEMGLFDQHFDTMLHRTCILCNYKEYYSKFSIRYEAIDDTLLNKMYPYMLELLMENVRYERDFRFRKSSEFKNNYYDVLEAIRFWNAFLKQKDICAVVFGASPHELYDMTIYRLCDILGIDTICTCVTKVIPNNHIVMRHYDDMASLFEEKRDELGGQLDVDSNLVFKSTTQQHFDKMNSKQDDLMKGEFAIRTAFEEKFAGRFGMHTAKQYLDAFKYREFQKYRAKYRTSISTILSRISVLKELAEYKRWLPDIRYNNKVYIESCIMREQYEKLCVVPDKSDNYVFYAYQYIPEATSLPDGIGLYCDQQIPIEILAEAIPDDWYVYVKMHPAQLAYIAGTDTFERINENPKVKLISVEEDSYVLTRNSRAVATLTGHIFWEAQFLNKPALVFGASLGGYAPWAYPVRTVGDCVEAIDDIISNPKVITERDLKQYLKIVDDLSFYNDEAELTKNLIEFIKSEGI